MQRNNITTIDLTKFADKYTMKGKGIPVDPTVGQGFWSSKALKAKKRQHIFLVNNDAAVLLRGRMQAL